MSNEILAKKISVSKSARAKLGKMIFIGDYIYFLSYRDYDDENAELCRVNKNDPKDVKCLVDFRNVGIKLFFEPFDMRGETGDMLYVDDNIIFSTQNSQDYSVVFYYFNTTQGKFYKSPTPIATRGYLSSDGKYFYYANSNNQKFNLYFARVADAFEDNYTNIAIPYPSSLDDPENIVGLNMGYMIFNDSYLYVRGLGRKDNEYHSFMFNIYNVSDYKEFSYLNCFLVPRPDNKYPVYFYENYIMLKVGINKAEYMIFDRRNMKLLFNVSAEDYTVYQFSNLLYLRPEKNAVKPMIVNMKTYKIIEFKSRNIKVFFGLNITATAKGLYQYMREGQTTKIYYLPAEELFKDYTFNELDFDGTYEFIPPFLTYQYKDAEKNCSMNFFDVFSIDDFEIDD